VLKSPKETILIKYNNCSIYIFFFFTINQILASSFIAFIILKKKLFFFSFRCEQLAKNKKTHLNFLSFAYVIPSNAAGEETKKKEEEKRKKEKTDKYARSLDVNGHKEEEKEKKI
jgi:hypothetical protein